MNNGKQTMKKAAVLALSASLFLTGCSGGAGGSTASGSVAKVNGTEILRKDYEDQLNLYAHMMAVQAGVADSVTQVLIQDALVRQDLEKNKVEVKKETEDEIFKKMVENLGGEANYKKLLEKMGLSDAQYRTTVTREALRKTHFDWYKENHKPSDEDIQKYYEQNKDSLQTVDASHILVATEEEAQKVEERLAGGEAFETVAKEVSTDTGSAQKGGELGEASPSSYVKEFSDALAKLKDGEVSKPVKSQFGYHIIRLNHRNDSLDALKDNIVGRLANQTYSEYLTQLEKEAKIERYDQASKPKDVQVEERSTEEESAESGSNK